MQNYNNLKSDKLSSSILRILTLIFWICILFAFDKSYLAVLTLLAAIIHEMGHALSACVLNKKFKLQPTADGFRMRMKGLISYADEIFLSLGGPLVNLILFLLLIPTKNSYIRDFAIINCLTALSNLLPIEGYDGYRILNCSVTAVGFKHSLVLCRALSFALSSIACFLALFLMLRYDSGYWIYFIFLISIIKAMKSNARLFERKREISRDFKSIREHCEQETRVKCK